jgi:adenosylhomocysteine nucleosidase
MPLGIVIALPNEWGYLGPAFHSHAGGTLVGKRAFIGRLGTAPVVAVVGGVGKDNARRAAARLCEEHKATVLLSIGYAGALDPELRRGDIVLSAWSVNGLSAGPTEEDRAREARLRGVADASHEHHVYVGPLYTADRIVARHEEKSSLFARTGCPVVDMESWAVYSEARARNLPFLGVHTITDTAEEDIPALEVITPFLMSESPWRYLRLMLDVLLRPRLFWDMAMLNRDAKIAGHNAAHFLVANQARLAELAQDLRAVAARPRDLSARSRSAASPA